MADEPNERPLRHLDDVSADPDAAFVLRLRNRMTDVASAPTDPSIALFTDEPGDTIMIDIEDDTRTDRTEQRDQRARWLVLAAACIAVLGGLAYVIGSNADTGDPASLPLELGEESALALADGYFDSYNAGDVAGVIRLLAPGVAVVDNFVGGWDLLAWERLLAWNVGQRTQYASPSCAVTDQSDIAVAVECETFNRPAAALAADFPGVSTTVRFTVTETGFSELSFAYGSPDFLVVDAPFRQYLETQRPEVELAAFSDWSSLEVARSEGERLIALTEEWVAFYEANNCRLLTLVCPPR